MSSKKSHAQHHHRFAWKWVLLPLGGVCAAYVALVASGHGAFVAGEEPLVCPMPKAVCRDGNCADHEMCKKGLCGPSCPGNCNGGAA